MLVMEGSFATTIVYTFIVVAVLFYYHLTKKYKHRRHKPVLRLPPGSMGWPGIGETFQLYSKDPDAFLFEKQNRYGDVFKTHILGCPCLMLASPEAARFVLVTNAELFRPTYPRSKETMIGPAALFFHQGDYHTHLRKLVQTSLSPQTIKKLIPRIESIAASIIHTWAGGHVTNTFQEMKKYSFEVGVLAIFGELEKRVRDELRENYCIVDKGYNSFPTRLPGTAYSRALMARKRMCEIIEDIIRSRKEKKFLQNDLLGHLLNFKNDRGTKTLTNTQISDNIFGVLFAAQDTTASALTWILKYLHDHTKLLEAVKAEQKLIFLSNDMGKKNLTWNQTRNMPLTYKIIQESLRMASIVSFTFREAVVDVEYNGFLIPKGWKVMPLFRNIHHNPNFFSDPQKFDPYRFEVPPKPNSFMPFGNGTHSCPGNELAKLEILTLIHHLINKFRWEVVGQQDMVQYRPFPVPYKGLPARFLLEHNADSQMSQAD